ncbi:MAG: hypothetical protein WEB63_01580 [Cucumibacter sp.]
MDKSASSRTLLRASVLALAILAPGALPVAVAAEADVALIKSYVGNWRGRGDIVWGGGTEEAETLLCRMSVEDTAPTKIGVDGRCSLAGGTLNMLGTIAYVDATRRFEAIVSSNTAFTGIAIGHRTGESLSFDLRDYKGDDDSLYDISAQIELNGDAIQMSMRVVNKESGQVTLADIPFERR